MELVAGGIGVAVAGVVAVLFFLATRDTRDLARKLAAAKNLAVEAQARSEQSDRDLVDLEDEYRVELARRDRQISVLRADLEDLERVCSVPGNASDIVVRGLRSVLEAARATPAVDHDQEDD